ncbi:hypothetical protein EUGRSUZ_A01799 [Eucalyptus grandis]|uniref:Uncharacterized protein n=2 Tax=Eucalyptus grandis TaxID=71139 RepID=A0ACC3M521_EUCGR|nr:hypothetical protein EUGRSUZ_A01799 [Eucalyptus grandis]
MACGRTEEEQKENSSCYIRSTSQESYPIIISNSIPDIWTAMNTLARNSTSRWRNLSRRKRESYGGLKPSYSYRRERAKQRQVFLKTYRLGSADGLAADESNSRSLCKKKVLVKAKAMVVSVLSFMRISPPRSCNCQSAISALAPQPLRSHCF